ncbi:MAG: hypothetical protein COT91_02290 [Candidatus Doudnabacteria bacterium CG10_big_fil_rev_8_21_14_0_10_41_10]|uniref:Type IV secretion system coupling protein TraD DNA-binding domain-containing protein n=1 Tax=Candidatus Doudnabacteria bacterium CG10_big_fil_rev_8_21_14_0_10_41_10 TaxID=1974551 RepID=A0A2H0VDR4_9BACT|nr:MAG: hypothetical protein COT91_02290 [Candidatus Doudnabacteria bacterium CG10_big_fil_rev_8_21_14_0_10_41_10]
MDKEDIILFAKTNFRNRETPFGMKTDDRRRHTYVVGKTGMGKSAMLENMAIQDVYKGHGICFVDPHGEAVEKILKNIPASRINDVVYFNPADIENPIAFNILEYVDPNYKHLVASGLMGVFTKIWAGVWSARMEYILGNTILALLDSPGNTMMGISRMYVDKTYRKKIIYSIKDPIVKSFWVNEFANYNDKFRQEAIAPIQNKVGQFLSTSVIRNIVGQPKSTIDLREIMDNKKILLVNLSKGRVGEDSSALLGAMLVTRLQLAAMSRVDIPEEKREDFYLYIDEFQNFATESFATILSEARKYRLNLIMAHQYIGQLINDKNTKVRDAVFGNVGTMIVFRIGADDAEYLEKEFEPVFTPNDLLNQPKYHIYLKLMIDGITSNPFSAGTLPPISNLQNHTDKIIRVSQERYANKRDIVESKISRWIGQEFFEQSAREESSGRGVDEEEDLRFDYSKKISQKTQRPGREGQSIVHPSPKKITKGRNEDIWEKVIAEQDKKQAPPIADKVVENIIGKPEENKPKKIQEKIIF